VTVTQPPAPIPIPAPTPIPIPEPPRPTPKPVAKGGHAPKAGKEPKESKEAKAGKEQKPLPPPKALEASTLAPTFEATAATVRITARTPEPELSVVLYVEGAGVPEVRLPIKVGARDTFTHKIFGNPGEDFRYRWEISDGKASKELGPFKFRFKDGTERP
jgi:outer membrane biosynthesis protein TonB